MTRLRKTVHVNDVPIGQASTWDEVHALLGAKGIAFLGMVREIQIGQRYRKVDAARPIWRVIDVGDQSGIRHCRIVDENDPTNIKLISEMTLSNPRFYHLEPTDAEAKD
jgi:hypothetical protein